MRYLIKSDYNERLYCIPLYLSDQFDELDEDVDDASISDDEEEYNKKYNEFNTLFGQYRFYAGFLEVENPKNLID